MGGGGGEVVEYPCDVDVDENPPRIERKDEGLAEVKQGSREDNNPNVRSTTKRRMSKLRKLSQNNAKSLIIFHHAR